MEWLHRSCLNLSKAHSRCLIVVDVHASQSDSAASNTQTTTTITNLARIEGNGTALDVYGGRAGIPDIARVESDYAALDFDATFCSLYIKHMWV